MQVNEVHLPQVHFLPARLNSLLRQAPSSAAGKEPSRALRRHLLCCSFGPTAKAKCAGTGVGGWGTDHQLWGQAKHPQESSLSVRRRVSCDRADRCVSENKPTARSCTGPKGKSKHLHSRPTDLAGRGLRLAIHAGRHSLLVASVLECLLQWVSLRPLSLPRWTVSKP